MANKVLIVDILDGDILFDHILSGENMVSPFLASPFVTSSPLDGDVPFREV